MPRKAARSALRTTRLPPLYATNSNDARGSTYEEDSPLREVTASREMEALCYVGVLLLY